MILSIGNVRSLPNSKILKYEKICVRINEMQYLSKLFYKIYFVSLLQLPRYRTAYLLNI